MATSLAQQLKNLRTPQTSILLEDKRRPSLLFDPKEAATLDRETVLNIGQSGLNELIKISKVFLEFRNTLFAQSSLTFERAVQTAQVNQKLNAEIEKFLIYISPYFLLNNTHKALEWLVCRYHIHQYNKDQYLMLILPYHETRIFVRALQLMNLSDPVDKWHWLHPLQNPGVPLASITLLNRVRFDNGLLKLVCNHVVTATKICGDQAATLSTLYAFYTTVLLGTIDASPTIVEVQVNHILPSLIKGLKSPILDFAASSYMILAKLTTRVMVNNDTMEKLLLKAFKNPHLKEEAVTLLFFLYASPVQRLTSISKELVLQLAEHDWFTELLKTLHSTGNNGSDFIALLVQTACHIILENPTKTLAVRSMVNNILSSVTLEDRSIDFLLSNVLRKDLLSCCSSKQAKDFLGQLYRSLEKSYPTRFDNYLNNLMKSSNVNVDSKLALQFVTSWQFGAKNTQESVELLDRLTHVNAIQRIVALNTLARNDINIPKSFHEIMRNTLLARFNDSDIKVVKALLSIPTRRLTKFLSTDTLVDELIILLTSCHTDSRRILAKPALRLLLELCENENTSVFITSLPYLFPSKDDCVLIAMQVLCSNFGKQNTYMQHVLRDIGDSSNAEAVTEAAFHNILNRELLPPTEDLLSAMKQQISHGDAASMFFNMILLGSVCRVPVGSLPLQIARDAIEMTTEMIKRYPRVKPLQNCNNLTGNNIQAALELTSRGILPLQTGTYVIEMVHRRLDLKLDFKLDFENKPDRSYLILRLLEMFFEGIDIKDWRTHYSRCLQIFFQRHFSTVRDLIRFLSQLFIQPIKPQTSFNCLKISLALLDECKTMQWAFQDTIFMSNLLLALARENTECRVGAISVLQKLTQTFNLTSEPFLILLRELVNRSTEIALDRDQVSLSLYVLLSPDPDVSKQLESDTRKMLQEVQETLINVIIDPSTAMLVKSELMETLVHVNGPIILERLAPLGLELLTKISNESCSISVGIALQNILQRVNSVTVEALNNPKVWQLVKTSLLEYKANMMTETGLHPPSVILLKQINETFFDSIGKISTRLQEKILTILVDIATDCENGIIVSNANKAIRRIRINARFVVNELSKMQNFKTAMSVVRSSTVQRRYRQSLQASDAINSRDWKRGITLLEYAQHTENIRQEQLLYPILFDLLKTCLSFEEQSPVEYTNQLLLSTIHRLTTKELPLTDAHLQLDIITQCIRTSRNPQTHHHALLVLVELLKMVDVQRALYTIIPIFTFMGSSVVRQDDAYSIQIISKTIETVVPIVNAAKNETHACEILRTFITSLPDIPEHRRSPLFVKLLQLLDSNLHLYYLLTFESQVISNSSRLQNPEAASQRIDFALHIAHEFLPLRMIQVCVQLAHFMIDLPVDIEDEKGRKALGTYKHKHIFDVGAHRARGLRHYRLVLIQFLSNLLSSSNFINQIAELVPEELETIRPYYDELIIALILLIQSTTRIVDQQQNKPIGKYWKLILHHLFDVLDLVNSLLPNEVFLISIRQLIDHHLLPVKRKALELLNTRLQQKTFGQHNHLELLDLVESILKLFTSSAKTNSIETEVVQQTALITLKLLTKLLASQYPTVFRPILDMTTELLNTRDGPVLASAMLCVAELCSALGTYAIQSLTKFVPPILQLLKKYCYQEIPDMIVISIVSALQKIVESVGNFLSLYLDQLLIELTKLNSFYKDTEHPKIGIIVPRLKATTQKLATCIPLRVLLPAVNRTYSTLISKKSYESIPSLMKILAESFNTMQPSDLKVAIPDLANFFLKALQFREEIVESPGDMEIDNSTAFNHIVTVEESTSSALVALVLKLSEATFRPLYYRLYDWAARNAQYKQRNITFYRLSASVAEHLKSLFVLFAGHILNHAATLLNHNNTSVSEKPQEFTLPDESNRIELIESILLTLHRIFTYSANNFITQERFDALAQPIVNQLENVIGGKEAYEERANKLIVPCLASFANAVTDDTLHKLLVYQTLSKTRHAQPYVRSASLNALVEIARKLKDDFMPLLPETVPFLAELLEDEDEVTEKYAQEAVRTLEEILGEPLQKYF